MSQTTSHTGPQSGPYEIDESFLQDPHEVYDLLRAQAPAHKVRLPFGTEAWVVTRYDDARAALSDPRLSKDMSRAQEFWMRAYDNVSDEVAETFDQSLSAHMLNADPPDHTRLRRLVNKAFTARRVEALRPRIEEITESLLDAMAGQDEVDLLESFAFPLPITVICELLGVPIEDRSDFRKWSALILSDTGDEVSASRQMAGYLRDLIARKRASGGDDLLHALLEASDDNDQLSEHELIAMVFLLLVAGHETTVNLIGNGVLALLRNPSQLELLRADPALLPGAVEEFLRYDGPINLATFRWTVEPVRLGDVEIPMGEFVLVSLLAANHDPGRFADPSKLDVTRPAGGHVAFGHGIHYCLGAPLARLEGEIAIGRLLERFPGLRLASEQPAGLRWRASTLIHGLEELPVKLAG
ncbi:cytochrome P450 family protein [Flindersiella endophytica]